MISFQPADAVFLCACGGLRPGSHTGVFPCIPRHRIRPAQPARSIFSAGCKGRFLCPRPGLHGSLYPFPPCRATHGPEYPGKDLSHFLPGNRKTPRRRVRRGVPTTPSPKWGKPFRPDKSRLTSYQSAIRSARFPMVSIPQENNGSHLQLRIRLQKNSYQTAGENREQRPKPPLRTAPQEA